MSVQPRTLLLGQPTSCNDVCVRGLVYCAILTVVIAVTERAQSLSPAHFVTSRITVLQRPAVAVQLIRPRGLPPAAAPSLLDALESASRYLASIATLRAPARVGLEVLSDASEAQLQGCSKYMARVARAVAKHLDEKKKKQAGVAAVAVEAHDSQERVLRLAEGVLVPTSRIAFAVMKACACTDGLLPPSVVPAARGALEVVNAAIASVRALSAAVAGHVRVQLYRSGEPLHEAPAAAVPSQSQPHAAVPVAPAALPAVALLAPPAVASNDREVICVDDDEPMTAVPAAAAADDDAPLADVAACAGDAERGDGQPDVDLCTHSAADIQPAMEAATEADAGDVDMASAAGAVAFGVESAAVPPVVPPAGGSAKAATATATAPAVAATAPAVNEALVLADMIGRATAAVDRASDVLSGLRDALLADESSAAFLSNIGAGVCVPCARARVHSFTVCPVVQRRGRRWKRFTRAWTRSIPSKYSADGRCSTRSRVAADVLSMSVDCAIQQRRTPGPTEFWAPVANAIARQCAPPAYAHATCEQKLIRSGSSRERQ